MLGKELFIHLLLSLVSQGNHSEKKYCVKFPTTSIEFLSLNYNDNFRAFHKMRNFVFFNKRRPLQNADRRFV